MQIDTTPCSQLSVQRDHSRLSCHHVCKRPSKCPDAVCHETISKMASRLTLQEHAPTLQNEFALPTCSQCLEILLRFHGQDAPWASQIANEMSNQAAMWSSWDRATSQVAHLTGEDTSQGRLSPIIFAPWMFRTFAMRYLQTKTKAAQMSSLIIQRQLVMQAVNRCWVQESTHDPNK